MDFLLIIFKLYSNKLIRLFVCFLLSYPIKDLSYLLWNTFMNIQYTIISSSGN